MVRSGPLTPMVFAIDTRAIVQATTRRLVAISMLDVVGFSGLVEADEEGTLTFWRQLRQTAIDPVVARWGGRVFKSLGDGLLIEFASPLDATRCMLEVQDAARRHGERDHSRALALRCAVHLADLVAEEDDLLGDGVNIVARLQEVAEPGGVILSAAVYDQIHGKLKLPVRDLGNLALRSIARPVHAYALEDPEHPSPFPSSASVFGDRPSIAVLPFAEYDAAPDQKYFGEGIVEEIVGNLASLRDLSVISRSSTLRFRSGQEDVRAVGRALGVRYVLSGSIRRAGSRIRISGELADTDTQRVLWTDRVDGTTRNLFTLQDRLAARIATTIAPHVREAELRRVLRKRPENFGAYDLVLRGLDLLYRLRQDEFDQARQMFMKSIELDSSYAAPYAYCALWHSIRLGQGWSPDPDEERAAVARLAEAALERDQLDASALALCGHVRALRLRDYEGARTLFDRALSANPNSVIAWVRSSPTFSYVGDHREARRRVIRGLQLSPLDPHIFFAHSTLALACYTAGDYDAAIAWARRSHIENPNFIANLRILTTSLSGAGKTAEARLMGKALLAAEPGFRVRPFCRGYAYREAERRERLAQHFLAAGLPR